MRAALTLLLLGAMSAPASAAWSPPENLSSAHLFIDRPSLTISGNGTALATWDYQDGSDVVRAGTSKAARAPGADGFGPARALVPRHRSNRRGVERVEEIATFGRRRALLAFTRPAGRAFVTPRVRLGVRFGRADGTFGRRRTIRRPGSESNPSGIFRVDLAVNRRGDAALAWFEDRGVRTDRVYVALRRAGRRFGEPVRLATGRIRDVSAAIGASGDVLVAWDARGELRTRFKPRGRRSFRATDKIRSEEAFNTDMAPVVTPNGRAVLAWSAQFTSEGGAGRDVFFQAALRPSGAERFRRAELLERMPGAEYDGLGRPIDAVVDATGKVAVAWTGAGRTVRATFAQQSGAFEPPQELSPPGVDSLLSDLAAGPGGEVLAVWDDGIEAANSTVGTALVPEAGAPFGPPEPASPAGQDARFATGAFDPRTGTPTIVWSNRPEGSNRPIDEIETFAQASTRVQ